MYVHIYISLVGRVPDLLGWKRHGSSETCSAIRTYIGGSWCVCVVYRQTPSAPHGHWGGGGNDNDTTIIVIMIIITVGIIVL